MEPNRAYDVRKLIEAIVDGDSFLEVKANYAKELVTGFARLNGKTVGIVANQPMQKAERSSLNPRIKERNLSGPAMPTISLSSIYVIHRDLWSVQK